MKAFGLELRRADITSLYHDVDRVIESARSEEVQRTGTAHSLSIMLEPDKWFSVCTVKECAILCNIIISHERMKLYNVMHCIHWSKMDQKTREILVAFILDDFREILNPNS